MRKGILCIRRTDIRISGRHSVMKLPPVGRAARPHSLLSQNQKRNHRSMGLFPVLDLLFGFLFCDSVFLLNLAKENFASAGELVDFIIGQFVPLHLHRTTELLPVTLYLIPVRSFFLLSIHDRNLTGWIE